MSIFSHRVDVDAFNTSQRGEVYGDRPAMTAEQFEQHVERNAIDMSRSRRWTVGGTLSGIALLGFRGARAWIGGLGVVPEFRGRGLGQQYLQQLFSICRDADAVTLELEVLQHNAPAIALYKRGGFATVDELIVWSRRGSAAFFPHHAERGYDAAEIALVARTPSACWQREPQSVAAVSPCRCLTIGDVAAPRAYAFIRRGIERITLLDAGACDTAAANQLLDALDDFWPAASLRLINEPAHGPLHQALAARKSWTQTTRQHRMRLSLVSVT